LQPEQGPQQGASEGGAGSGRGRALAAASLSCLLPGAGQLYLRRWRRGTAMLLVAALCLAGAGIVWNSREGLPRLMLQPSWLLALLVLDVLLLAFRVACVVDAYRLGGGPPRAAPGPRAAAPVVAGLALVMAVTVVPHAAVGYYDLQTYDLLTSVFRQAPRLGAAPVSPGANGSAPASLPDHVNILLIGGDAGYGRTGLRTDTMIVASVRPASGRVVLFGMPRNLVRVPLPRGPDRAFACRCFPRPLNELYAYAQEHPALFPGAASPGVNALRGAAERLLGIRIDYHALVDLQGFIDVVDALGGATIWTTEPIHVEIDHLGRGPGGPAYNLKPGRHHLDGATALAYARSRKTTSDYDRMRRQRCLLEALAQQTGTGRLLRAFPRLVRVVKRNVSTDIPLDQLPNLLATISRQRPRVEAIGFTPPDFNKGWAAGYPIPDVARIRQAVRATLPTPEPQPGALIATAKPMLTGAPTGRGGNHSGGGAPRPASHQAPDPCRPVG
jgi:polyisoprenyl-teichoic acid--peptidoglycan teichoic acid transferase